MTLHEHQRPLGYESPRGFAANPLISRRTSETTSNSCVIHRAAWFPILRDVLGWCGSKTGADDLWVLPKPLLGALMFQPWLYASNPCLESATRSLFQIKLFENVGS